MSRPSEQAAITFLASVQCRNGAFLSLSSPDPNSFNQAKHYSTTFTASLILGCLAEASDFMGVQSIQKKIVAFLLAQKNAHGSYNYWDRTSEMVKQLPYPDDLDDTFCALSALYRTDPALIDGKTLAQATSLLTATESAVGGPYRTWLAPKTAAAHWHDIDLAVNNNIAYFLTLQDVRLPSLIAVTENAIASNSYISPYYYSAYPLFYFISRWYTGPAVQTLITAILSRRRFDMTWGTPMQTALALSSLIRLKATFPHKKKTIEYLYASQKQDGSWEPEAFCIDPALQKVPHFSGSSALTTALCLEALCLARAKPELAVQLDAKHSELLQKIETKAVHRAQVIPPPLNTILTQWVKRICNNDTDATIRLLPKLFCETLAPTHQNEPEDFFLTLSLASLFGWIAYTIYDTILDCESLLSELPAANIALREMVLQFAHILPECPEFHQHLQDILDQLESINTWETTNCRISPTFTLAGIHTLPDYGDLSPLAHRSLGHALGSLAVLYQAGYTRNSLEIQKTQAFFHHYIIARQLNDDAHDWKEDLQRGHLTAVVTSLLQFARTSLPKSKQRKRITAITPELEQLFWQQEILTVCTKIALHLELARESLATNPAIAQPENLEALLRPIEQSIQHAQSTHNLTTDFLTHYSPATRVPT